MHLSPELLDLITRFGFNVLVVFIIVKLIYQRNHPNNLDFVFVCGWSDFKDYKSYCDVHSISQINHVSELLKFSINTR